MFAFRVRTLREQYSIWKNDLHHVLNILGLNIGSLLYSNARSDTIEEPLPGEDPYIDEDDSDSEDEEPMDNDFVQQL